MKKILMLLFCTLVGVWCFANGRVSIVTGGRYYDSKLDWDLDNPLFSIERAQELGNGKVQFKHTYTVEETTSDKCVFIHVAVPKNIKIEAMSLDNGILMEKDKKNGLPLTKSFSFEHLKDSFIEYDDKNMHGFGFYMENKKGNTSSVTFSLDISNCKPDNELPVWVYFYGNDGDLSGFGQVWYHIVHWGSAVNDLVKGGPSFEMYNRKIMIPITW